MKAIALITVLTSALASLATGQVVPERGETADEFLDRYAAWLETIPQEDRAWDEMLAIQNLIESHFGSRGQISANPEDERWEKTTEFVRSNPELIERIKGNTNTKYLGLPRDTMLDSGMDDPDHILVPFDFLLPHLASTRDQVILLATDSILAARTGDIDRSIESLEAIRRLQDFLPLSYTLLEGMVEIACSSVGSNIISNNHLSLSELDESQLHRLSMLYVQAPLSMDELKLYGSERWSTEELLKSFYKGSRGGRITLRGTQRFLTAAEMVIGEAAPEDIMAEASVYRKKIAKLHSQKKVQDEFWTLLIEDMSQEFHRLELYKSDVFLDHYTSGDLESDIEYAPATLFLPSMRRWHTRLLHYRGYQSSYSLLIALHLHRVQTGSLPESYDDLGEGLLSVPPIDPHTGELLSFKVDGSSITIYSTGPDRDDDGGRPLMLDGEINESPEFLTLHELDAIDDPASIDGDWILYSSESK